jgi:adenosylhomocysteinase
MVNFDVRDLASAAQGKNRILWADRQMPVLTRIRERFEVERPLRDRTLAACLHVTAETANLCRTLKAGGARVLLCASNPLSTQDEVAASLVEDFGIEVFAIKGEDHETYYRHINEVLEPGPDLTMDDGADLVTVLHSKRTDRIERVIGGTEETTTGVIRLRSMERDKVLRYPIIAVNDAKTKHLFDNRYGTGQSTIDGILRCTNMLLAGSVVVVAGYGYCGRGVAMRARGMGSNVIVTEVEPLRALEAAMDGYRVMPMGSAAPLGDLFVTLTGDIHVIRREHFLKMKDGAILANSGHFNVEIDIPALEGMSTSRREVRPFVEEFVQEDGRRIHLLGNGRLINLTAAEGHPASVMDMSFANQALCAEYMASKATGLERRVYVVPHEIDEEIARVKLAALKIEIDRLTEEQVVYLRSWDQGT